MLKLLTFLLSVIKQVFDAWRISKIKDEVRQESIKELNDAINRQIELGEAAASIPDPERAERLRRRFDRSHTDK